MDSARLTPAPSADDTSGNEPEWHRAERERASHFDGFTWRCDPATDEGFKIPRLGDAGQGGQRRY